jgi:methionine-rich copper-binding protein CopC
MMKRHPSSISPSSAMIRLSCSCLLATLFWLAVLVLFPAVASAHAEYVSSDPAANTILKNAPSTITIHFSEELDPKSTVVVYDVDHQVVSQQGSVQVSRTDLKTMTIALQSGMSGSASEQIYLVDWNTIAADDQHHDTGSFRFFVNPNPMLVDMLKANSTSGQTNTTSSGGLPVWSSVLIGVVALLVGGLAGVFFGRRRPQKA